MKTIHIDEYVSEKEFSKQIHEYIDASFERIGQRLKKMKNQYVVAIDEITVRR